MLEDPDSLPAMLAQLLDGPLGEAIDDRARGSIDDMLAPDALARSLDRPRSPPYRLEPRHRWQVEAAGGGSAVPPGGRDQQRAEHLPQDIPCRPRQRRPPPRTPPAGPPHGHHRRGTRKP